MKHLNTYNELHSLRVFESSESTEEIEQYIKDILLELNDIGFETSVVFKETHFGKKHLYYQIVISNNKRFKYADIEEAMLTLDSYLRSIGCYRVDRLDHNSIKNFRVVGTSSDVSYEYSTVIEFTNRKRQ